MNIKGTKILITGGSDGIGKATAAALKAEGGDVIITGRREEHLAKVAKELGVDYVVADVGKEDDVKRTYKEVLDRHGRLDVLINNAGFGVFAPLVETDLEQMEAVYRTNVFGAFMMGKEAAKLFIKQGAGHLINIASTAGTKGFSGGTAYASSKFALRGMTECWRDELRRHNVRVTLVNPSEVLTEFANVAGFDQEANEKKLRAVEIADAIVGLLKIDNRGFIPELAVFATNPF